VNPRRLHVRWFAPFDPGENEMIAPMKVMEIRVCFQDRLKNAIILVGTQDVGEARRIARIWGEQAEGEPVTRTIFRGLVPPYDSETVSIEGITVWPPLF
jgi:hypothetical protein